MRKGCRADYSRTNPRGGRARSRIRPTQRQSETMTCVRRPLLQDVAQRRRDFYSRERAIGDEGGRPARVKAEHGQRPKPTAIDESSADEVHAPPLIGPRCRRHGHAWADSPIASWAWCARSVLRRRRADRCLRIDAPTFTFQQYRQSSIAEAHAHCGDSRSRCRNASFRSQCSGTARSRAARE